MTKKHILEKTFSKNKIICEKNTKPNTRKIETHT